MIKSMKSSERGIAHILLLLAAVGLLVFVLFSSTFSFKSKIFDMLFPKPPSHAALDTIQLGSLTATASGTTASIQLPIAGDDNNNATASLEYKRTTDTVWTQGPVLARAAVQGIHTTDGEVKAAAITSVPDVILVKFKPEVPNEDRQVLLARYNLTITKNIQSRDTTQVTERASKAANVFTRIFRTVLPNRIQKNIVDIQNVRVDPANRDKVLQELRNSSDIEYAEKVVLGQSLFTPNDPLYSEQWDLSQINAPAAWDINKGSPAVVVAVIDSGLYINHEDLIGQLVPGYDFVDNTFNMTDCYGHGTAVTGRITTATNNGKGIASLASNVKVMPLRDADCNGWFNPSNLAIAILYAVDHGVKVINISQGIGSPISTILDAINYARNKGVTVVAAAGQSPYCLNGGTSGILYPAAYPGVIAVGATLSGGTVWSSNCTGPELDTIAPGAGIKYTTKTSGSYGQATGTSFAAPQVAALAALLYSINPSFTPAQISSFILGTATDFGVVGRDDIYGYGRINAAKAVQYAQAGVIPGSTSSPLPSSSPITTISPSPIAAVTSPSPSPLLIVSPSPVVTLSPTPQASTNGNLLTDSSPSPTPSPAPVIFNNILTGNITSLNPNTAYDIRITLTDPDGVVGGSVVSSQVTTGTITTPSGSSDTTLQSTTAFPANCNSYTGVGSVSWSSPSLALISDGNPTVASLITSTGTKISNALICNGYKLNVPSTATVVGIKVGIERRRSNSTTTVTAQDYSIKLLKGSTVSPSDKATTTQYTSSDVVEDHGGSNDLWGGAYTPVDVNASNFGVIYVATGNVNVAVDSISATVYYTQ